MKTNFNPESPSALGAKSSPPDSRQDFPSPYQLAMIAATISRDGHQGTAKRALDLYKECAAEIERACEAKKKFDQARTERLKFLEDLPSINGPVALEQALKTLMPELRQADRMKRFRDYLRDNITAHGSNVTPENCLVNYKAKPIGPGEFKSIAESFRAWQSSQRSSQNTKRAKTAANKRWEKTGQAKI
jgi:hypothetical protein